MIAFGRAFAMPSRDTLSIPEIGRWAKTHLATCDHIVDPFARNCRIAHLRNDLDPASAAEWHLDAEEFLGRMRAEGTVFDGAIFDPPYSPRQISEVYASVGREVGMEGTQNGALYRRVRDALDHVMAPGSIVLSFGWNTAGMGKGRGYEPYEILMVHHGGAHNDTLCLAERKLVVAQKAMQLE